MDVIARQDRLVTGKAVITAGLPVLDEVAAVRRLVWSGVLRPEQTADSRLSVVDESRRCRCLIVRFGTEGWVVKQGTTAESRESIQREASVYRALGATAFTSHVPGFIGYDEDSGLLITEFVTGESPREVDLDDRRRHAAIATATGAVLARLHRTEGDLGLPTRPPPPILRCGRPSFDSVEFHSPASLEIIRMVQSNEALMSLLDRVHGQWTPKAITHNDLRGDNILVRAFDEPVFIDWEMGGPGDRRWDVAGLLAERLVWWLTDPDCWVPWNAQATAGEAAAAGIRAIREFAHAFLGGYVATFAGVLDLNRAGLTDLMSWCAARLVHFAIENTHQLSVPLATARQLMQMAANIATNPDAAARTFFGLALAQ
ncbi:Phosphotransferase enzyme family [Mycobacterium tuberculosis]|nr:Phosphotransferase enzyme family [Mycobacterium tuberculosis]